MSNQDKEYYIVPFGSAAIFHPGVEASKYPFLLATPDQEILQYNQLLTIAMSCDVLAFNDNNAEMGSSFEDLVSFIRNDCGFDFYAAAIIPVHRRNFISKFADMMRSMDSNEKEASEAVETFNNHLRSMAEKVIPFPIAKENDLPDIFYAIPFRSGDGATYISHPDDLDIDFNTALTNCIIVQASPEQTVLDRMQMSQFIAKHINSTGRTPVLEDSECNLVVEELKGYYDCVAIVSRWAFGRLRQTARICNQLRRESQAVRSAADAVFVRELRYCASKVFEFK